MAKPKLKVVKKPLSLPVVARGKGQPSRRAKLMEEARKAGLIENPAIARMLDPIDVDNIYAMSEEEAEAALVRLLSPAHLNLMIAQSLQKMVAEGGRAGSEAAHMLQNMQKQWAPSSKRRTLVSFQVAAAEVG